MRSLLFSILFLFSTLGFSQILTVGGIVGTNQNFEPWVFGGTIEIKPREMLLSLNIDPTVSFYNGKPGLNLPIYLKITIGKDFRVSPTFGGFFRFNKPKIGTTSGLTLGLMFEQRIFEKSFIFLKVDAMKDYWDTEQTSPGGAQYIYVNTDFNIWFNVGMRTVLF